MSEKWNPAKCKLIISLIVLLALLYKRSGAMEFAVVAVSMGLAAYLKKGKKMRGDCSILDYAASAGLGFYFTSLLTDSTHFSSLISLVGGNWWVAWLIVGAILSALLMPIVRYYIWSAGVENPENVIVRVVNGNIFYGGCLLLAGIGLGILSVFSFSGDIWIDEAWTMRFIAPSYSECLELLAADVHPPLYYLIVKLVVDVVHLLDWGIPDVHVAKLCSVVPLLVMVIVGGTYIRKRYGRLSAGMYMVLISCTPVMLAMGVEARMYSWAVLFVSMTYLCAERLVDGRSIRLWGGFVLFSLCAAYTHYYAIVAVMPAYLYVASALRGGLKAWILACLIVCVCYSPWLLVFVKQVSRVGENYWIPSVDYGCVVEWVKYVMPNGFFIPMYLVLASFVVMKWQQKNEGKNAGLIAVFTPAFVILVALVAAMVFRPVFVSRYMVPALGVMWLGVAILTGRFTKCNISVLLAVTTVIVSVCSLFNFSREEWRCLREHNRFVKFAREYDDAIYVSIETQAWRTARVITGCTGYGWQGNLTELWKKAFGGAPLKNIGDLKREAASANAVFFLSEKKEEIERFKSEVSCECHYQGQYRVGRMYEVYRVELN